MSKLQHISESAEEACQNPKETSVLRDAGHDQQVVALLHLTQLSTDNTFCVNISQCGNFRQQKETHLRPLQVFSS